MSFLDRLLGRGKIDYAAVKEISDTLRLLSGAEADIGNFYTLCAAARVDEKDFWEGLAEDEFRHARYLQALIERVNADPGHFRQGYSFNAAEIRLFTLGIQTLLSKMGSREITTEQLLKVARDIEGSLIELKLTQVVETKDEEFNRLAGLLDAESKSHREKIEARIDASSGEGASA